MRKGICTALLLACMSFCFAASAQGALIPDQMMKALGDKGISCNGELLAADQDTVRGRPSQLSVMLVQSDEKYALAFFHENKDGSWRVDGFSYLAAYQNDDAYNHIPFIEKNSNVRFTIRYTGTVNKHDFQEFVFTVYQSEWMLIDAVLQAEEKLVLRWWPKPDNKTVITLGGEEITISQRISFSEFDLLVHPNTWLERMKQPSLLDVPAGSNP